MSVARSIQVSVTHVALGVVIGSLIEGALPRADAAASLLTQTFEALVQVGLNGAALSLMSGTLRTDDPTFGIPFSMALFQVQPELAKRIQTLGGVAKDQIAQVVQRTAPLAPAA
jgi:hypothetical protein